VTPETFHRAEDLPILRAIVDQLEASVFKDSLERLHAEAEGQ